MRKLFRGTPGRELFLALVCLVLFAIGAYANNGAAQSGMLFRYVSENTGSEVYAAKGAHRKVMDAKNKMIIQTLGYVYLAQEKGTVPLYGLKKMILGQPAQVRFTASEAEYQKLMTSGQKWQPYFDDTPVIAYVSKEGGNSMVPAYRFVQTNVLTGQPRYRFEGAEYDQWKKLPGVDFHNVPDFYIWKDKPAPLLISGGTMTTTPGTIAAVAGMTDQSIRMALYNNGKDSKSINTKNGATFSGQALVIKSSEALTCDAARCLVNLGWFVDRNQIDNELKTFVSVTGGHTDTGAYATFPKGEASVPMVVTVPLKFGLNHIALQIKPEKTGDDINTKNNTQKFRVVLEHSLTKAKKADEMAEVANGKPKDDTGEASGKSKIDISIRKALYCLAVDATAIDLKRPRAVPGTPLVLYKKDAIGCNGEFCIFNFGFTANRPDGNGKLDVTAEIARKEDDLSKAKLVKIYSFADGSRSFTHIRRVGLKMGSNTVYFGISPVGDVSDPNSGNNMAEVEVIVKE